MVYPFLLFQDMNRHEDGWMDRWIDERTDGWVKG